MFRHASRFAATAFALPLLAAAAFADDCTKEPKTKWINEAEMKTKIEALGYTKFDKIKVDDNCYEIKGTNKDGKKVEVKFNPVDGKVVKEEVEDDDDKKDDKK